MLTLYQFYRKQKYADIFLSTWNTILYNVIQSLNIEYAPLWHGSMRPHAWSYCPQGCWCSPGAVHPTLRSVPGLTAVRNNVPPIDGSAQGIPGVFDGVHIRGTSRPWHLLHVLGVKKFSHQKRPMWSCVVVLELEVISIYPSCIWKTLGLQDVTVDDGVDVSFRYSQWRFSAIVYSGPYHHWASTSLSGFTDAVISEVLAT